MSSNTEKPAFDLLISRHYDPPYTQVKTRLIERTPEQPLARIVNYTAYPEFSAQTDPQSDLWYGCTYRITSASYLDAEDVATMHEHFRKVERSFKAQSKRYGTPDWNDPGKHITFLIQALKPVIVWISAGDPKTVHYNHWSTEAKKRWYSAGPDQIQYYLDLWLSEAHK